MTHSGYIYIYIYMYKYFKRKKGRNYIFPTSLFRESLHSSGVQWENIHVTIVYIVRKFKKFKVQLLRSNALFLCRHEDTSSLRLFSDERSGRQIIRNFSFRQRLHLLLELL